MLVLCIHSYPGGNSAVERHWDYFMHAGADLVLGIATFDGICRFPETVDEVAQIGCSSYINGPHLPQRLIDTLSYVLEKYDPNFILVAEYDTVIFRRIELENLEKELASHLAGGRTWESKATAFYHNPWLFSRAAAEKFIPAGRAAIDEGICGHITPVAYGTPEASPDVFFGYIAERLELDVQTDLWTEFSRNDLFQRGNLELAREAYLEGVDVIHGIKTQQELEYILNGTSV